MASAKKSKNRVSVWNWLLTLLLMSIPGVNLIVTICILIFAKAQPKRNYAWAVLIWTVLITATAVVVVMVFPDYMNTLADMLRSQLEALPTIAPTIAPTGTPIP